MPMTRAERLAKLVTAICPELAKQAASGAWGELRPGVSACPYSIDTLKDGRMRVRITNPIDGESRGGVGKTVDEALTALEAKVFPKEGT